MAVHVGQRFGNYRLIRLLGRGGFAEVYLSEHFYLKSQAAVKVLLTTVSSKEEQDFLSEGQILAKLTDPHIVPVREFAVERGMPFMVMDYLPGGTLRQRYPQGSCLSLTTTLSYVQQIASALQYAHNHHVIHRDIKPENLLLDAQQNLMLSDFGISQLLTNNPQGNAGTPAYMAPEQWQGEASFASDQYALGVMVYEMLCGVRPFAGSRDELQRMHTSAQPPFLREKDPSLPKAVEAVVLKALAKDPKDRYPGVIVFARALEQACRTISDVPTDSPDTHAPKQFQPASVTTPLRVFFSSAPDDIKAADRLKADLKARDVFVTEYNTEMVGEEKIRQAIREAQIVLLLLSEHTRSSSEVQSALAIAALYRRPLLCIWIAGDSREALLPASAAGARIIDARAEAYRRALDEVISALKREIKPPIKPHPLPDLDREPRNPYKGLSSFTQDDASDFFGREKPVQDLVELLKPLVSSSMLPGLPGKRLLAVIGPSGSGKSSLVMAGLLPQLQQGNLLPAGKNWIYLDPISPGEQPLDALAYAFLSRFPGKNIQDLRAKLLKDARSLHQLAMTLVHQPENRIVLLIDQFEELFSPTVSEQERQQFIDLLLAAVTESGGPLVVLLTLRADYYDRTFAYPALGQLIQQQQSGILPMELEDLSAAIERPTYLPDVWLHFEDGLVGDLLFEMRGQIGALPLLQFTLEQLFQRRQGHTITRLAYQEIGGVKGALSRHIETTYASLPSDEHRDLARTLFLRLVNISSTAEEPRRRRATLTEFIFEKPTQTQFMQETIEAFLSARLLTSSRIAGTTLLEVSHEALLREWPQLKDWIQVARDDMQLRQILHNDVTEWEKRGRPNDHLYSRARSKEIQSWQERRNLVSKQEADFLHASGRRQRNLLLRTGIVVFLIIALLLPTGLYVRQFFAPNVSNLNDSGSGSLRQAIDGAEPGSTITIDPGLKGILYLATGLRLTKNLTIHGPGANRFSIQFGTVIDPLTVARQFIIEPNVNVYLSGIAFKNSVSSHSFIFNNGGTLIIDNCIVSGNTVNGKDSAITNQGRLTLRNSTISDNTLKIDGGGSGGSTGGGGGGIFNSGSIELIHSIVSNNRVISSQVGNILSGGGIDSTGGKVLLENSTVSNNKVGPSQDVFGGGIYIENKGILTATGSSISNNIAMSLSDTSGGGISAINSIVNLSNTIVAENKAISQDTSDGGGISIDSSLALDNGGKSVLNLYKSTVANNIATGSIYSNGGGISTNKSISMNNSTVSGNKAVSDNGSAGGGIEIVGTYNNDYTKIIESATFTFDNSTLADNSAVGSKQASKGGGLMVAGGKGTITSCTISGNVAISLSGSDGGGMRVGTISTDPDSQNQVILKNTIIAGNHASTGSDLSGSIITNGYNLLQIFSGVTFTDPLNLHQTDLEGSTFPTLGIASQLQNNGGPTQTLALLPGSPALDKIPLAACANTTDQRGIKRPQGAGCDIGAYEYVSPK